MLDIREFNNHINNTYPIGSYWFNEWSRIKTALAERADCSGEDAPHNKPHTAIALVERIALMGRNNRPSWEEWHSIHEQAVNV